VTDVANWAWLANAGLPVPMNVCTLRDCKACQTMRALGNHEIELDVPEIRGVTPWDPWF
jgi:hypothetical protein